MPKQQAKLVLTLYKTMLREAAKFPAYNFRMYSLRKIRDGFRLNRSITDQASIQQKYDEGLKALEVIKRQVVISTLYKTDNLVIENAKKQ